MNDPSTYAPRTPLPLPPVSVVAAADLPTKHGNFRLHVFVRENERAEHVAAVHGDVWGAEDVAVRIHSECLTGDVFGSCRCDCGEQLQRALQIIAQAPRGIVLYLRQEGRGIGLTNKIRAYRLQTEEGLDTVDANLSLGFRDDEREYGVAVAMLRIMGVRSVSLLTNNPDKVRQLRLFGMPVQKRVPHVVQSGEHNQRYLETKARRSGHLFDIDPEAG